MDLNSTKKLHNENEDQPSKKARIDVDEEAEPEEESMKIIDLNDDCLENIFDYLEIIDLINVASSNTTFQYAARLLFQRKYGGSKVIISNYCHSNWVYTKTSEPGVNLDVCEIKQCVMVFGDLFHKICFNAVDFREEKYHKMLDNISEHSKAKYVDLRFCYLNDKSPLFSRTFSKIQYLEITSPQTIEQTQLMAHFPNLTTLELRIAEHHVLEFMKFCNLNPHLEKLKLTIESDEMQYECPKLLYHFKTIKDFSYSRDWNNFRVQFPFTFDQLETLTLSTDIGINQIDKVIKRNGSLIKLTMEDISDVTSIYMSKQLGKLPEIEFRLKFNESYIGRTIHTGDYIVSFLNAKKCINPTVRFVNTPEEFRNNIQNKLDESKWDCTLNTYDSMLLKRK